MPDGLKRLPDHVVAPLLRALACIPRRPDTRLLLQRAERGRPPTWDATADYDVIFRGRKIGRVWRCDYAGHVSGDMARYLWHWDWSGVEGRQDANGHAPTLESAMADFRRVWDAPAAETA
jgi:hypothetical protein